VSRWAVVLAGGVGARFWPLSTPERPKQLLPLVTDKPLLADAVDRLAAIVEPARTLVLTNESLVKSIRRLLPAIPRENIIAEPRPAGTAAALTWAALAIERRDDKNATMISVHADWFIGNDVQFREVLLEAEEVAQKTHTLVTVGIVPTRADQGFGYIQAVNPNKKGGSPVKRFVEKPDRARRGISGIRESSSGASATFWSRSSSTLPSWPRHLLSIAMRRHRNSSPASPSRYRSMSAFWSEART